MFGSNTMKKFQVSVEAFIQYVDYQTTTTKYVAALDQISMDLFNHPNFSMMKQTDEQNVNWTNTAENEWFHSAMPFSTNFYTSYLANSNQSTQCRQVVVQGYTTKLSDPNVTWGGNPSFAPDSNTAARPYAQQLPDYVNNRESVYTYQQGVPAGVQGSQYTGNVYHAGGQMSWSKSMMDMLP